MSKKLIYFLVGLAGVFLSPLLFELLANLIQNYGPAWVATKISRINHLTFWALSFVWAAYFGIWVWKSGRGWFTSGDFKRKFILISTLAALLRLAVIIFGTAPLSSDAKEYDQLAQTLAHTGTFQENGKITAYRPIGYPAFLAGIYTVFGRHTFLPKLANVLLDVVSLLLLWKIFTLWKDEETALKAVAIVAFYPPTVYTNQNLLSEHLFGFLWIFSIFLWEKSRNTKIPSFLSGLSFGLSALVRPVVLVWGIIPTVRSLDKRRRLTAIVFLVGAAVATGPWLYRNHKNFGLWTLSTNSGLNFWMGTNPQATGYYHIPDSLPFDFSDEAEVEKKARRLGWEYLKSHPRDYLRLGLVKEAVIFGFDYTYLFGGLTETPAYGQLVWGILGEAFWWILFFFAALKGAIVLFNPKKRKIISSFLPIGTLFLWAAVHFFFIGTDRFHHPLVPFFAFLAALTLSKKN